MAMRHLVRRGRDGEIMRGRHPLQEMQEDMQRLVDDFFRVNWEPFGSLTQARAAYAPSVNVVEDEKEVRCTVELPGMDEKDINISVTRDNLMIEGEKREEQEEKGKEYYRMERSYGSFRRVIQLPAEVDESKAEANFSKGVLTIRLPKTPEAQRTARKIEIKTT